MTKTKEELKIAELKFVIEDFMELCEYLHDHHDEIPKKLWDGELWDLVYQHFEP